MKHVLRASLLAIALVLATSAVAQATTTRIPFSGTSSYVATVDPGVTAMTGTVVSVRGLVWDYASATDNPMTTGIDRVVINYDLDVATGLGTGLWGTDTILPTAYPDGGFACHWSASWVGGMPPVWYGHGVCHGFGTLTGWQYRYEMTNTSPAISGYLFQPGN